MKAKMNNWKMWGTETRLDVVYSRCKSMLTNSGFHIMNECFHIFSPYGFTAIFLLGESHFAIHTFPEENKTYYELTSCVDVPFEKFIEQAQIDNILKLVG